MPVVRCTPQKLFSCLLLCLLTASLTPLEAREIDFAEDFVLAEDKQEVLKKLIPGTGDYYFYHALYYQNNGQFDNVEKLFPQWRKRLGNTRQLQIIENRQALLTYNQNPSKTLAHLQKRLGLSFNHTQPLKNPKVNLATELDPAAVSWDAFRKLNTRSTSHIKTHALERILNPNLSHKDLVILLKRLSIPDHPQLVELVHKELSHKHSRGFGNMNIHKQMLKSQLDALVKKNEKLRNQSNFVRIYLSKLVPNPDIEWRHDIEATRAYLDRMEAFTETLSNAHNSLKAHVLYHRLAFERKLGNYDRKRFMKYIQLPNGSHQMNAEYWKKYSRYQVNLNHNAGSLFPSVRNDSKLMRDHLLHFMADQDNYYNFSAYLSDKYLKPLFAEAKIVSGKGDVERWASMLSTSQYRALKERVDLDFDATNQTLFLKDEVNVGVHLKNIKKLHVNVYHINAAKYAYEKGRAVNTDLDLDGLTPNFKKQYNYEFGPERRHYQRFSFANLNKAGTYIIDFVGNGQSSRVLIQKGVLRMLEEVTPAGLKLTILDQKNVPRAGAKVWYAGRIATTNENGQCLVPFYHRNENMTVVLSDGDLVTVTKLNMRTESYNLQAGFYVDRESLIARRSSEVIVRPNLYLNGSPVSLSKLEDVKLTIQSNDLEGVSATEVKSDFKVFTDRESTAEFNVPDRLQRLSFTLQAKISQISKSGKKQSLSVSETFYLNQIDGSDNVMAAHLARYNGGHVVEVLGKSGEPIQNMAVRFQFTHEDFSSQSRAIKLKTDARGQIHLGTLPGITRIRIMDRPLSRTWTLTKDDRINAPVHAASGQAIQIPALRTYDNIKKQLILLEKRQGTYQRDLTGKVSFKNHYIQISGLDRGDYELIYKHNHEKLSIHVTEGKKQSGYVMGEYRMLETQKLAPMHVGDINKKPETVTIKLLNASKFARVHVLATKYLPDYNPAHLLSAQGAGISRYTFPKKPFLFKTGRKIGDELRYIMLRRDQKPMPGNMLTRPELLLNPWAVRDTNSEKQNAGFGSRFGGGGAAKDDSKERSQRARRRSTTLQSLVNLDFLQHSSLLLTNLLPDDKGNIEINRKALDDKQHLHIIAIDPLSLTYRQVSLEEVRKPSLDLRLRNFHDPKQDFTQQRQITAFKAGDTFKVEDVTTSKFEIYDSLSDVYQLYQSLNSDSKLREFQFILNWPTMTQAEKTEQYAKYACHELNFFLAQKDTEFFNKVIKPYLANKKDKTFLDHYLLGHDLAHYLKAWHYARLNTVERILLASRIKQDQSYGQKLIEEQVALIPYDPQAFDRIFRSGLKGQGLSRGGYDEIAKPKQAIVMDQAWSSTNSPAFGQAGAPMSRMTLEKRLSSAYEGAAADRAKIGNNYYKAKKKGMATNAKTRSSRFKLLSGSDSDAIEEEAMELFATGRLDGLESGDAFYQKLSKTQEWAENNYYKLPISQQLASLVRPNRYWHDIAQASGKSTVSPEFAISTSNFTEMMFALATMPLPFGPAGNKLNGDKPASHDHKLTDKTLEINLKSPAVIFHQQIKAASREAKGQTPIIVTQNFFMKNERTHYVGGEQVDKFVTEEFLPHKVYGCQVVVTNPTSRRLKLDLLLQIPEGAVVTSKSFTTRTHQMYLGAYSTQNLEYFFYFPLTGKFKHYPVRVARNEKVIASAQPFTFNVVGELSKLDTTSWDYVADWGKNADVIKYLSERNLPEIQSKLSRIAWRMTNKSFYAEVIELLRKRHGYHNTLWSYSIKHNDKAGINEFLRHQNSYVSRSGNVLSSPLLTIDPIERYSYQHLEYSPLVNARAHELGKRRQIVNSRIYDQYHQLLGILAYQKEMTDIDLLSMTYYLLLQDRVLEAMDVFEKVDPNQLATRLQYDYFAAYMDFFEENPETARKIAAKYRDYPAQRWRKAFANIQAQLDELDGKEVIAVDTQNRTQQQTLLADKSPVFDFKIEDGKILLTHENLSEVTINYYEMDIELLFSKNPFVQQQSGQFAYIKPNDTNTISLKKATGKKGQLTVKLPQRFTSSNILVEIVGAGKRQSQAHYANSLNIRMYEQFGQIKVTHMKTNKPLPGVYVKVYARHKGGSVKFYKDGYTDIRGRFDYTSLNTNDLDTTEKFSILVYSKAHGAVIKEARPPRK